MLRRRKRPPAVPEIDAQADVGLDTGAVRIIRPSEQGAATQQGTAPPPGPNGVAARADLDATADIGRPGNDDSEAGPRVGSPWSGDPGWLSADDRSNPFQSESPSRTARSGAQTAAVDGVASAAAGTETGSLDATIPESNAQQSSGRRPAGQAASRRRNPATAELGTVRTEGRSGGGAVDDSPSGGSGTDPLLREGPRSDHVDEARVGGSSAVRLIIGEDNGEHDVAAPYDGSSTLGLVFDPRAESAAPSVSDDTSGEPQRRTVVIADDGGAAASAEPAPSARRGMDPRFRERRRAVRRALGRKRMVGLGIGAVALLVILVVAALLASGLFAVRASQVEVIGWQHADRSQVDAVLDGMIGTPVLRVDEDQVAAELEAIAWIETAKVTTALPNSATVEIAERTPLATFQGPDGRYRVIDRYGRALDILDGFPVEFVWITSATAPNLEIAEFAPAGFTAAAELSRNLTPEIRPRVQRIAVEPSGQALVIYMRDGARVNFGAATDLFSKLVRLQTLVTTYPEMTDADIDVSTVETTRASDDLLKIKQAERQREAEAEAAAEAAAAEAAAAEAADNGPASPSDGN